LKAKEKKLDSSNNRKTIVPRECVEEDLQAERDRMDSQKEEIWEASDDEGNKIEDESNDINNEKENQEEDDDEKGFEEEVDEEVGEKDEQENDED